MATRASNMIDPATYHANSRIEEVSLDSLRVDRSYQREPSQDLIETIAREWDVVASELVLVSDRGARDDGNGGLWLVNGQHRSLAARKRGDDTIWARVVDLSKLEDPAQVEAALRLKLNVKLGDRPLERFKAQIRSGDEDSLDVVRILARFDTEINPVPSSDTGINCVSTVEAVYRVDRGAILSDIMETLRDSFKTLGGGAVSASMIKAVGWFIERHSNETDRDRLVSKMGTEGPAGINRRAINMRAAMGGSGWMNHYRALVEIYNEGLSEKSKIKWVERGAGTFAARSRWGAVSAERDAKGSRA